MKSLKDFPEDKPFDDEEAELMAAVARGEFTERMPLEEAKAMWKAIAENTLRKKPITVRVQERDIAKLKSIALRRGIPYQTLVASVLHQFAEGTLKETA
jgi:predicted DNA binding CopG/RHH family protein